MSGRAARVARMGLLFALAIALSFFESALSGFIPVPGIKLGLSNIVTMYCLFCLGWREAYTLAALKSLFVLLTRGMVGAAMSLSGGLLSVTVMLVLVRLRRSSYLFISICGGLFHNIGQLAMAAVVMDNLMVFYYFPVLAAAGVGMGVLTGVLLRTLEPALRRLA